jgi:uncharacterized membrane protein
MKWSWKTELPLLLVIVGLWVAAALAWPTAPDRIPVHWGMNGEVDRYGGRAEGLIAMPAIATLIYIVMLLVPRLDPGRLNYTKFVGAYTTIRVSVIALLAVIYAVVLLTARGVPVDMNRFIGLAVGAMFFVMGNVMGKLRPNWFFGVRTPWTLSSKRSWTHTHRLAGWVFVVGGMALITAGIVGRPVGVVIASVMIVAGIVVSVVYSYFVWRSDPERVPPAGTLPANGERL